MRAITLTQPWATLVALGVKRLETRSWATSYRGPLAIHAGQGLGPVGGRKGLWKQCHTSPFVDVLRETEYWCGVVNIDKLPRGAVVAVCELRDVRIIGVELNGIPTIAADDMLTATPILGNERAFGNYGAGRYAWLLAGIRALPEPIPAKGALSLWEWDGQP